MTKALRWLVHLVVPERIRLRVVARLRRFVWRAEGGKDTSIYDQWRRPGPLGGVLR